MNQIQLTLLLLSLVAHTKCRDPTFAIETRTLVQTSSDATLNMNMPQAQLMVYRVVSIAWLRYLADTFNHRRTPEIWLHVSNLPRTWNDMIVDKLPSYMRDDVKNEITLIAQEVIKDYLTQGIGFPHVRVHRDDETVDEVGVTLNMYSDSLASTSRQQPTQHRQHWRQQSPLPTPRPITQIRYHDQGRLRRQLSTNLNYNQKYRLHNQLHNDNDEEDDEDENNLSAYKFNRTIVISFEDPPYGQSRINRLVTNRNVTWHNLNIMRLKLSNHLRRIDTTDLRYRYAHNIGHLLGLGHFIEIRQLTEQDRRLYERVDKPKVLKFRVPDGDLKTGRSVMTADTNDNRRAAQYITQQDRLFLGYLVHNLDKVIEESVRDLIINRVPKIAIDRFTSYGRYII